ncbi:MAG: hypothetical protein ABI821_06805 [Pseudomonadota bacterium]
MDSNQTRQPHIAFIASALLVLPAAAYAARPGILISQKFTGDVKVVSSDGQSYDAISGKTYPLSMQASGYCKGDETVHDATMRALNWPGSDSPIDVSELRDYEKHFSLRPVLVPYSLTPIAWHANWKKVVVDACNANLAQQMNAHHWTASKVMSRDWKLNGVVLGQVEGILRCNDDGRSHGAGFDSSGQPSYSMQAPGKVNITCGKKMVNDLAAPQKPKTPVDDLTYGVHVVQANLAILPKTGGSGPCGVTLSGVIETDAINTNVTFFYRNNKGGTTPWRSVKTDQSKTAFFSDFIDFGKPSSGGFTQPTPAPSGPASGTFAAPQSNKDFHGTYQIVGKNIKFESNVQNFSFNCTQPAPNQMKVLPAKPPTVPPVRTKKKP